MTFTDSEDQISEEDPRGKKVLCTMLKILIRQAKQKKRNHFDKKKRSTKHKVYVRLQKQVKKALNLILYTL